MLPKSRCPLCGSHRLGAWHDGEGNGGQFCNDCEWEEDYFVEPTDPDEHPSHPDHHRQPDDTNTWRGD